jgi:hypothetical protein
MKFYDKKGKVMNIDIYVRVIIENMTVSKRPPK